MMWGDESERKRNAPKAAFIRGRLYDVGHGAVSTRSNASPFHASYVSEYLVPSFKRAPRCNDEETINWGGKEICIGTGGTQQA